MTRELSEGVCAATGRILAFLQARPASTEELAEKSSKPTVHRALRAMRAAGAELTFNRMTGTWALVKPWSRPPSLLTRAELVAIAERRSEDGRR
jgi:DNA-binding transcriptional ArsR family regulator